MKDEQPIYKQGFRTGYMTAVLFLYEYKKDLSSLSKEELYKIADDLIACYNKYPCIEKITIDKIKELLNG